MHTCNHLLWGQQRPAPQPRCFLPFRWTCLYSWAVARYFANIKGVTYSQRGFPGGSEGKESACSTGDLGLIPGLGRSPGEGNGYPLQYSCLGNPLNREAWRAPVHGVAKRQLCPSDSHFPFLSHSQQCRRGGSFDLTLQKRITLRGSELRRPGPGPPWVLV